MDLGETEKWFKIALKLTIKGKTVLLLGAGGGLGGAIAASLAREGVKVALSDINMEAAEQKASAIRAEGDAAIVLEWDLGKLSA